MSRFVGAEPSLRVCDDYGINDSHASCAQLHRLRVQNASVIGMVATVLTDRISEILPIVPAILATELSVVSAAHQ